jgi:methylase of polypeptide subunit release factors
VASGGPRVVASNLLRVTTPRSDDPKVIVTLRDTLDRAPFTGEAIREALGTEDEVLSRTRDIPVHMRRLRERGSFGALVQLFVLNVPVPIDLIREAIAPLTLEAAERMGILRRDGAAVRPLVRLVPHDHLIIASDLRLVPGQEAPNEHVPGVHRPTVTLARLTVRTPVKRGLDLGTGNGVEAILMRPHVEHVVGSDVNARAIEFARFNGHLNRTPDIDWRVGSWFAAMKDERFDVIACNPPYVISPATQYIYRDSGLEGDSVSEQVVREVAAHLTEGGYGTVTVSWAAEPADTEAKPVRRWVAGTGCDAWILHYRTEDPLTTAKNWNEQDAVDAESYGRVLDDWLAYYERLGITGIAYGAVVLRRRTAPANWSRVDPLPGGRLEVASDHIRRVFAAGAHLQGIAGDGALLDERFRVPKAVRITRIGAIGSDGSLVRLSLEEGVGFQAEVDDHIINVLASLETGTLREALDAASTAGGLALRDRERFVTAGATLARRLYGMGLIERDGDVDR